MFGFLLLNFRNICDEKKSFTNTLRLISNERFFIKQIFQIKRKKYAQCLREKTLDSRNSSKKFQIRIEFAILLVPFMGLFVSLTVIFKLIS